MLGPVVLTRPLNDGLALAEKLRVMGRQSIVAPLIGIELRSGVRLPDPAAVQAIVFTSANGIDGLMAQANAEAFCAVPVIAVGPASAAAARAAGFAQVEQSGGDVAALVETVCARCRPDAGVILYPSGVHTAGDLEGRLQALGFAVERVIAYEAVHARQMPGEVLDLLVRNEPFGVVLYSPRTARIWCELLQQTDLHQDRAYSIHYYCLSQNVAGALDGLSGAPAMIEVAEEANEQAMLALLAGGKI